MFTAGWEATHPIDHVVMAIIDFVMVPLGGPFVYRFDDRDLTRIPRNLVL